MRPVRILLVAVALIAAGLTGWALGTRGDPSQPGAGTGGTAEKVVGIHHADPVAQP